MENKPPQGRNTTVTFMTYLAVICLIFTALYVYLIIHNREVPTFVTVTISFTLGPLVYTLTPKAIG
ncbi:MULTISPECIES: hypothetical protein [unclassified Microcoleus]|uniref:hypothetical protein n=1 Tax=unclassified Microcoleus TaxID=2642155 RepID=UPI002FD1D15C